MSRPAIPIRHLADPTLEQTEEAIHVMMLAFTGDPFMVTTLGGKDTDPDIYYRFNRAHVVATLVQGELWVAEDEGKIVGVALWFPPGPNFLETEEQRKVAGMDGVIASLSESMQHWWADYMIPRGGELSTAAFGPEGKVDAYYLLTLAVLPTYHNRGIGRSLMYANAQRAWKEGKRVCWEAGNEPNVAKYTKWGGRAVSRNKIVGDADGRGFDLWIMEMPKPVESTL